MILFDSFSERGAPLPFFMKGCTPSQTVLQEGVHPFPNFFSGRGAPRGPWNWLRNQLLQGKSHGSQLPLWLHFCKLTSTAIPIPECDCDSDTVLCDTAIPIPLVIPVCDTDFLCDTVLCDTAIPIPLVIPVCDTDFFCDTISCDTAIPIPLVIPVCDTDFLCDTTFYATSGLLNMKSQANALRDIYDLALFVCTVWQN